MSMILSTGPSKGRTALFLLLICLVLGATALVVRGRLLDLTVEQVTDDVWVIHGLGGNVGVLRTAEGAVVVDTMSFPLQGRRVRQIAEELSGGPIQAIINTHYHWDHTHGNTVFPTGTAVVASSRTLVHLKSRDARFWSDDAAALLPNRLTETSLTLSIGGKTIECSHFGHGHTDGDLVVRFVEDAVLHAGDLLFSDSYPRVDLEAGGSVQNWPDTLRKVLTLEFEHVIPGHGPLGTRADIILFRTFLEALWQGVSSAAEQGASLEETLATTRLAHSEHLADYVIPFVVRRDARSVVRRAWEEATGNFQRSH